MVKIIPIIFIFFPVLVFASTVSDFIVNSQSAYDVPPGTTNLLILDLTLPDSNLKSIRIHNSGNLQQRELTQLSIYEDGSSPGWDGDETEITRRSFSPFFDYDLAAVFSKQRIFITVNVTSTAYSGRTIKPALELNSMVFGNTDFDGPTNEEIIGFERVIRAGVSAPSVPVSPMVQKGEALSTSTIRWYFTDLSNNEFGFKIIDDNLKTTAQGPANISYLDEIGLEPETEYSSRKIVAYNDRGQSIVSSISIFPAVRTLAISLTPGVDEETPGVEEAAPEEEVAEEAVGGPLSPSELRAKIQELQLQLIDLLKQLIQLFQEQLVRVSNFLAGLWFLQSFFGR